MWSSWTVGQWALAIFIAGSVDSILWIFSLFVTLGDWHAGLPMYTNLYSVYRLWCGTPWSRRRLPVVVAREPRPVLRFEGEITDNRIVWPNDYSGIHVAHELPFVSGMPADWIAPDQIKHLPQHHAAVSVVSSSPPTLEGMFTTYGAVEPVRSIHLEMPADWIAPPLMNPQTGERVG